MIVEDLKELSIVGVYDRGIPNKERIVLFAKVSVNVGQFGVMLGIRGEGRTATPIRDNLLWFGDGWVNPGDWIFIYTGPGVLRASTLPNSTARVISTHWGRSTTVLHDQRVVPILFKIESVQVSAI